MTIKKAHLGSTDKCKQCDKPIIMGLHGWEHKTNRPRHQAAPKRPPTIVVTYAKPAIVLDVGPCGAS